MRDRERRERLERCLFLLRQRGFDVVEVDWLSGPHYHLLVVPPGPVAVPRPYRKRSKRRPSEREG